MLEPGGMAGENIWQNVKALLAPRYVDVWKGIRITAIHSYFAFLSTIWTVGYVVVALYFKVKGKKA